MEEDEENYLAILSDSADHCVTRKVSMEHVVLHIKAQHKIIA